MATRALNDPGVTLVRYDAACRALALARSTDEVRKIRSGAAALAAYAKQAKNRQLEVDAAEIRIRAERRVGELIRQQKETVGLSKGGRPEKTGGKNPPVDEVPTLAKAGIDKDLAKRARELAGVPAPKFERLIKDWRERAEDGKERVTGDLFQPKRNIAVHQSSETPEHYTPAKVIDLVIKCLGAIDLDPCGNPGTPNVPAAAYFTKDQNGLRCEWQGRVYMNPPYGSEIDAWVAKLCEEYVAGRVTEAIALLPARTDTQWFLRLRDFVCCFVEGRLTFIGNHDPAPFPSAIFYLGEDIGMFYRCFCGIGDIWQRLEPGMFAE